LPRALVEKDASPVTSTRPPQNLLVPANYYSDLRPQRTAKNLGGFLDFGLGIGAGEEARKAPWIASCGGGIEPGPRVREFVVLPSRSVTNPPPRTMSMPAATSQAVETVLPETVDAAQAHQAMVERCRAAARTPMSRP